MRQIRKTCFASHPWNTGINPMTMSSCRPKTTTQKTTKIMNCGAASRATYKTTAQTKPPVKKTTRSAYEMECGPADVRSLCASVDQDRSDLWGPLGEGCWVLREYQHGPTWAARRRQEESLLGWPSSSRRTVVYRCPRDTESTRLGPQTSHFTPIAAQYLHFTQTNSSRQSSVCRE